MAKNKRYRAAAEAIDRQQVYSLEEAVELFKAAPSPKFDESVDLAINLGVDPRHADQMVRGAMVLPHGIGKETRVLVFAKGEKEKEAQEAGADYVGGEDLAKKITEEGWLEFERVIATPDMMSVVGRLGKVLGPRGLMPNPKLGTVTMDVGNAVRENKAGKVEYRVDKTGIIHAVIGKKSFDADKLVANAAALIDAVVKAKPAAAKGVYMKKISMSTTMGPGIRIDPSSLPAKAAEELSVLTRTQKEDQVAELREKLARATTLYVADYRGIDVDAANALRRRVRKEGEGQFEYRVLKNSVLRRAVEGSDFAAVSDAFAGPTAVALSFGDPVGLAKILEDFAKDHETFELKGGVVDGAAVDRKEIATLATLPSLEELRGKIVGLLQAPASKLARLVSEPGAGLARALSARAQQDA